jgi:hypothetical protein
MTRRIRKLVLGLAALAALGAGGAVFAQAQSTPTSTQEQTTAPDRDSIQSGDQTTPDPAAASTVAGAVHHARVHNSRTVRAAGAEAPGAADTDTVQSGDQTTPEQPGAGEQPGAENPERSGEAPESASNSDGPGGHADEPGNANADHQFQGNE